jgi:purine nucleosidase
MRFALLFALASAVYAAPRPILLTTDCGADMDDQWAIAHLALSPEFEVRAVVTTHIGKHSPPGALAAETSARCAHDVLAHIRASVTPAIIPGSSVALPSHTPLANKGVDRILSESRKFTADHRLTVIVIGAATDTASALLTDPTLAQRIEIVAMGFRSWTEGGHEFNIENDPIAWQVILDSTVPVTVGDGEVTKRDLRMNSARAHAILDPTGAPGRYLAGLLDQWFTAHPDIVGPVTGDVKIWPVWDEVTVAYLLGLAKTEQRPRPTMQADLSFDHSSRQGTITWVTEIDADRLWQDLARRLSP